MAAGSGVAHAGMLIAFCDALVGGDPAVLERARAGVENALGPKGVVEVAAVASNFERMVRIADGTGIPLDAPTAVLTEEWRADLGLEDFGSAANTPRAGAWRGWLGRGLRPLAFGAMRLAGRRREARDPKR